MIIGCKKCDKKINEWDAVDGVCPDCIRSALNYTEESEKNLRILSTAVALICKTAVSKKVFHHPPPKRRAGRSRPSLFCKTVKTKHHTKMFMGNPLVFIGKLPEL